MKIPETLQHTNFIVFFASLVVVTMPLKSNINSITIILFTLYSCLFLYSKHHHKLKYKIDRKVILLILPFLFVLFQGLYSQFDVFSKNLLRVVPLFIFPICFAFLKPYLSSLIKERILKVLIISALGYSLLLVIVAFYRQIDFSPDFSKINWFFFTYYDFTDVLKIHPTYLGIYNTLAFIIVFDKLLSHNKKRFLNITVLIILTIVIFLSGSRIALASLFLIVMGLFCLRFRTIEKKTKILVILAIIILPMIVFKFVPIVKERMIDMTFGLKETFQYAKYGGDIKYNGGLNPRFQIWDCAILSIKDNIWLGNGFGTAQVKLNECYINKGLDDYAQLNYQTHNQYFSHLARGGIIGLLVLLITYFFPLISALKANNIIYFGFICMIILVSVTENLLNLHLGIVFFSFFNSLFFFSRKYES